MIIETIDADLEEIMDNFFVHTRNDLELMRSALADGDMVTLARLGHTAKGTGYGYGLRGMGDIGLAMEKAAKEGDGQSCREAVETMASYIDNVRVEYE